MGMRISGTRFIDDEGRTLMLRGLNLSGSSKVPVVPDGATHRSEGFFDHRHVSFVGRPFPLKDTRQHFERIRRWGFNFLRFLVTWEAIEHAGPGEYDQEYLEYITEVIRLAGEYDLGVYVDPHQDVWSRFSGGDGAPGWTFEAAGLDVTRFKETGAAIVHQTHGDPFPRMVWPTNAFKLGTASMFTLFFGGSAFAPSVRVDGVPIQNYLQDHYIESIRRLAACLEGMPHVTGYGTMNEPLPGFIGVKDLNGMHRLLRLGDNPTPLQAMALGAGIPQQVETWALRITGPYRTGSRLINANRERAWLPGREDIWRAEGVWDLDASGNPVLLQPDYFAIRDGKPVNFAGDHLRPFALKFARAIRSTHPEAAIFLEGEGDQVPPNFPPEAAGWFVHAPHWYDNAVLMLKQFTPWLSFDTGAGRLVFAPGPIRKANAAALQSLKDGACIYPDGCPALLGEFGVPMDMDRGKSFRTGDFSTQERAMNRSYTAVEDALLDSTLWNYTPDNTNARGDLWNGEDLSIYSKDQESAADGEYSGGRALRACIRPYPQAAAGQVLKMSFDYRRGIFDLIMIPDRSIQAATEIFIPALHYPRGIQVQVSGGRYEYQPDEQLLRVFADPTANRLSLHIIPAAASR